MLQQTTLRSIDVKGPQTPRVGPYGYEKGDARDPNAFLWPINDRISRIFTVYEYPKEEGWQKLFPINKRVVRLSLTSLSRLVYSSQNTLPIHPGDSGA